MEAAPARRLQAALGNALDSRRWNLILLPTEQCNFRCTYCYESFQYGRMRPEVVAAVKKLISRRLEDLSHLTIDWFGGEPLLARPVIRDISRHVLDTKGPELSFDAKVTTNGDLLDRECLQELSALGVSSYQVALDGWSAGHDETRRRYGGGGSFESIWSNLLSAQRSRLPFRMTLRVHFSPSNVDSVRRLIQEINRELGPDPRFHVFLKAIGRYGGPNDGTLEVYRGGELRRVERELRALIRMSAPATCVEDALPYVCYASKPNSLVIRSTGRVAKCTVALDHPANDVGELRPDGTLAFDSDRLQPWFVGLRTLASDHLACPWEHIRRQTTES